MAKKVVQPKGFMLYFDTRPALEQLNDSDRGKLILSMFDYAEYGAEPQLEGLLGMAWAFLRPKIDRDFEAYGNTVKARIYASQCREWKRAGIAEEDIPTLEEWKRENYSND